MNPRRWFVSGCFSTLLFSSVAMAVIDVTLDSSNIFRIDRGGDGSIEIHPKFKKSSDHPTGQDGDDGSGGTTTSVRKIFATTDEDSTENKPLWRITPVEGQNHLLKITDCETGHSIIISVPEGVDWNYGSLVAFLQGNGGSSLPSFSIVNTLSDPGTLESIHDLLQEPMVGSWCDSRSWSCFSHPILLSAGWLVLMDLSPAPQEISAQTPWQFTQTLYQANYAPLALYSLPTLEISENPEEDEEKGEEETQQSLQNSPPYISLAIQTVSALSISADQPPTHPVTLSLLNTPYTNSLYTSNPQSSGDGNGSGTSKYLVVSLLQRWFSRGSSSGTTTSEANDGSSSTEKTKQNVVIPGLLLLLTYNTMDQEKLSQ